MIDRKSKFFTRGKENPAPKFRAAAAVRETPQPFNPPRLAMPGSRETTTKPNKSKVAVLRREPEQTLFPEGVVAAITSFETVTTETFDKNEERRSYRWCEVVVSTDKLVHTPWNPPSRETDVAVKHLLQEVTDNGNQIRYPIVVVPHGDKLVIAEGNRRTHVARILGIPTLRAYYCAPVHFPLHSAEIADSEGKAYRLRTDADALTYFLYRNNNNAIRGHTGKDKLHAALLGGPVSTSAIRRATELYRSVFTPKECEELVRNGIGSPHHIQTAIKIAGSCFPGADEEKIRAFAKQSFFWMREHGLQQVVKDFFAWVTDQTTRGFGRQQRQSPIDYFGSLRRSIESDLAYIDVPKFKPNNLKTKRRLVSAKMSQAASRRKDRVRKGTKAQA